MGTPRIVKPRATTDVWGSLYAWHFDGSIRTSGPVLGVDRLAGGAPFGLDPFGLVTQGIATNPNIAISGAPGNGKSSLVKQLLWWLVGGFGYRMVATDVKSEYRALAAALDVPVLDLHPGGVDRVNPFDDPHGRLEFSRALASLCIDRALEPIESATLAAAIRALPHNPVLPDLLGVLRDMPQTLLDELGVADRGEALRDTQALRFGLGELMTGSLAGMFSGHTTVQLASSPRGFVVDVSGCGTDDHVLRFAMLAGQRAADQLVAGSAGRTLVVNDEAWRLAATADTVKWMQHSFKLGRQRGQANIVVVHRYSEIGTQTDGAIAAIANRLISDADTHIMFRAGDRPDANDTVDRLGLPAAVRDALPALPPHRCLIHVRGNLALLDVVLSTRMRDLADTNAAMRTDVTGTTELSKSVKTLIGERL